MCVCACACAHVCVNVYTCTVHPLGGMGGFMLSLFHKLETSKKTRKLQQLPLLKKEVCMTDNPCGGKRKKGQSSGQLFRAYYHQQSIPTPISRHHVEYTMDLESLLITWGYVIPTYP